MTPTLTAETLCTSAFGFPMPRTASERDVRPGDGRRSGAAVGDEDVAVDRDAGPTERAQAHAGTQGTADQPTDLGCATADLAPDGLPVVAGVGGAGQHRVLGGDPA